MHELLKIFRRQPQYDSPVGTVGVSELGAMEDARRDQTDISVLERVDIFSDLIGEIPLQKEIDFIVIMPMDRDIGELFILIVKNFKIGGGHVLPCLKLAVIVSCHSVFPFPVFLFVSCFFLSRDFFVAAGLSGVSFLPVFYNLTTRFAMFITRFVIGICLKI